LVNSGLPVKISKQKENYSAQQNFKAKELFVLQNLSQKLGKQIFQTYKSLNNWHAFQIKLFWEGILVGIFGGLVISLFRFLLTRVEDLRQIVYDAIAANWGLFSPAALGILAVLLLVAALLTALVKYEPMASGSGIPQVKAIIMGLMKMRWFRILWVKIVGGVVGIGYGLSLGREGPSIQIGAACAQGLSRLLGRTRMEERYLITSGAGAGLATAFNAPLAGVIFSMEELHRNFSGVVLLPAMTAALTATFISRIFFGPDTIFTFYGLPRMPLEHVPYALLAAIVAGFGGVIFNYGLLNIPKFYNLPFFRRSLFLKLAFSLLCATILGFTLPQVLGGGNALVNKLAVLQVSAATLGLLIAAKFIFTLISYGTGVPGGFFLPMLVLGALTGDLCAHAFTALGWLPASIVPNVIVVSMAAFFSASVRAPITGTVLILEMTGSFQHLMVLAMGAAVAYVVAELCGSQPIYEELMVRALKNKGNPALVTGERNLVELAVCSGSLLDNKQIRHVKWPPQSVVIDVKRGEEELIPAGDLLIHSGDFVYVLTDTEHEPAVRALGQEIQAPGNLYGDF
jgi:H+/Cl- antiporter ClcA